MSFTQNPTSIESAVAGAVVQNIQTIASTVFEDAMLPGRFVKHDAGSTDFLDSSASPVIEGVVLRKVLAEVDLGANGELYQSQNSVIDVIRKGIVVVDVVVGEVPPAKYTNLTVSNTNDADSGKILVVGGEPVNAKFLDVRGANLWAVLLDI